VIGCVGYLVIGFVGYLARVQLSPKSEVLCINTRKSTIVKEKPQCGPHKLNNNYTSKEPLATDPPFVHEIFHEPEHPGDITGGAAVYESTCPSLAHIASLSVCAGILSRLN
jgi:hypothetical protein